MSIFSRDPSRASSFRTPIAVLVSLVALALAPTGVANAQDPCVVPDNGSGTVTLPPAGCDYLSPDEVHMIIDGLPPGTTIELAPIHKDFICGERNDSCTAPIPPGLCEAPGGTQGGNADCFDSNCHFQLTGTGDLAGFSRTLAVPLEVEVHTGPRSPTDPVQDFPTEMMALQGQLPPGDPDFDVLRVTAGQLHGLPSPGHTTLTRLPGGDYNVDSFFDIAYQIEFVGAPGGPLAGMGGTTTETIQMAAGTPAPDPCHAADNGTGTVTLPPEGCEYLSPDEVHMIIDGLPPGTTIELAAIHKGFICGGATGTPPQCSVALPPGSCEGQGGSLGGNVDCFDSEAELEVTGTGDLSGYQRTLLVPLGAEIHTGPRNPGDPVQDFDAQMMALQGELPAGDPDFDLLRVTAGQGFGLPSPGHTTLTELPSGSRYQVDSFFDIAYQVDFIGAAGGPLSGMSGSTTGTIRMLPEPGALASLIAGGVAMLGLRRRGRRREVNPTA